MSDRHEEIKRSYRQLGNVGTMYDGIITRSTLLGKLVDSVIWGLDKKLAAKWINDALSPIPDVQVEAVQAEGIFRCRKEQRASNE